MGSETNTEGGRPKRKPQQWLRFTDGTPCPAFGWRNLFDRAAENFRSGVALPDVSLAFVVIGEHEDDIALTHNGRVGPTTIAQALGHAASGNIQDLRSIDYIDPLAEAYEAFTERPGRSGIVDVLVVALPGDVPHDSAIAHFGSRQLGDLVHPLGGFAAQLMATANSGLSSARV